MVKNKLVHILLVGAALVLSWMLIRKRCNVCNRKKELFKSSSEDKQEACEDSCFGNQYYDACMNSCLQDGRADYMETGNEYDVLGIRQVDDLDRGYGYDTPQFEYGLRGATPGR